eukprot:TRINITY_DN3457_c1_g1_i5.p1 TRINITY_DN3457_c1_g1~~TRINITY_DN3457_c1_g1_i5.p1  ORF type:complete len:302 (-),score=82.35 TRINITY_DN3457_c1_g1_i5:98-1003(-)
MFSGIKHTFINGIFITHLHGDHIFGLPSLLLTIAEYRSINVYGPTGLFEFIRIAICQGSSGHDALNNIHVHEFPKKFTGTKTCIDGPEVKIHARSIKHSVPCIGYVIEEAPRYKWDPEIVPIIRKEFENWEKILKCRETQDFTSVLKNGEVIDCRDWMSKIPGRKITILGDTSDPSNIADLANACDLIVHESTGVTGNEDIIRSRGHSTARMAGLFASRIGAKKLLLTHFGRAVGSVEGSADEDDEDLNLILQDHLETCSQVFPKDDIIIARDFLSVSIPRRESLPPKLSSQDLKDAIAKS